MKLEVFERVVLLNLLPKEGDYTALKLMRKLREDLSFSEEEHRRLNFRHNEGQLSWDQGEPAPKEVEIGVTMFNLIRDVLQKMDKERKLTEMHMGLFEKFAQQE